jgi:hypothetical protein
MNTHAGFCASPGADAFLPIHTDRNLNNLAGNRTEEQL